MMDQYDVNLYFVFSNPGSAPYTIPTVPIICADFQSQGIHGLLGRDILARASLSYHGEHNFCVLNF